MPRIVKSTEREVDERLLRAGGRTARDGGASEN